MSKGEKVLNSTKNLITSLDIIQPAQLPMLSKTLLNAEDCSKLNNG